MILDQYLEAAQQKGLQISHVFLRHFHADFLAGHLELRDRVGAEIYLGAQAQAEYEFTPVQDNDIVEFGNVRLQILETPGHSPESISILVYDLQKDERNPHAVLTGDTLFIGDVGRPDLRASLGWTAEQLGRMLYDSLHQKLLPLADETLVYPAHGVGSMCGKNLSEDTVSTMGIQRQHNYALQPMSREAFVQIVTADQVEAPDYFTYDAILNTKEHPTLEKTLASTLKPLTLNEVKRLKEQGAQILDVREAAEFAGAYLIGSINIGLGGEYATWVGTLFNQEQPIVIIAEPGREEEGAIRLGRIDFDHVAGYLAGGMQAVDMHPDLFSHLERITATTLAEQLASPQPPIVLDVRNEKEWREKQIAGSLNIPLNHLRERMGEVSDGRAVVVHCETGYRSSIAASLLQRHKIEAIADLVGGIAAWETAQLQTTGSAD